MKPITYSAKHKQAEDREKDLKLALLRIRKGRSRNNETKVTIAAVAREAGVSAALIHNYYPRIAEAIREAQSNTSESMRNKKQRDLIAECEKSANYRQEINELRTKVALLASINEVLLDENRALKEKMTDLTVANLKLRCPST